MLDKSSLFNVYLQEYQALKAEQTARIGFRDNLIYIALAAFGGIISFTIANQNYYALLVVPLTCLVLGWTYLINDEKISAIGKYIRQALSAQMIEHLDVPQAAQIFGWETAHRSDYNRRRRKIEQLVIDQLTFVFSGIASLATFLSLTPTKPLMTLALAAVEAILLIVLCVEFFIYADTTVRSSRE